MSKIITFVVVLACLCSCSVQTRMYSKYSNVPKEYLSLKVLQTLDENSALCTDANFNVVKVIIKDKLLYDGLPIYGTFVLVDTYRYITVKNVAKTVPVYMPFEDYVELMESLNEDNKQSENPVGMKMIL